MVPTSCAYVTAGRRVVAAIPLTGNSPSTTGLSVTPYDDSGVVYGNESLTQPYIWKVWKSSPVVAQALAHLMAALPTVTGRLLPACSAVTASVMNVRMTS